MEDVKDQKPVDPPTPDAEFIEALEAGKTHGDNVALDADGKPIASRATSSLGYRQRRK